MKYSKIAFRLLALTIGFACQATPPMAKSAPPAMGAASTPWAQKNRNERTDWMGLEVFPKMKRAFSEYDGESFRGFQCQTCHGRKMDEVEFRMPSDIFALSASDPIGEAEQYDEDMTGFMVTIVLPQMALFLDTKPYNPETKQGLTCFSCHPKAE